jgi:hypothetical protein
MRRVLFACALFALSLPAIAVAFPSAPGDGTLSVKNANGRIDVVITGAFIGSCDNCRVWVTDPNPRDGTGPIVSGEEEEIELSDTKTRFAGRDLRFRVIGGFFRLVVRGSGIDGSAVGQGDVTLRGWINNTGTYALNGGERRQLPFEPLTLRLGERQGG